MIVHVVLAALLGVAIGLSLGALGGGGSILTVPALVYALGVDAKHATGASLLIVGLSALIGMVAHHRAKRVRWSVGAVVGIVSIAGSMLGTDLNRRLDPDVLLLLFATLMFVVAGAMIARDRAGAHREVASTARALVPVGAGGAESADPDGSTVGGSRSRRAPRPWTVAVVGVGVGFLTGFLGVGGGFIIVPSLVLALGFELPEAVGTSLLIIALSSAFAIVERHGVHGVASVTLWPFAVSAMVAAVLGNRIASRVSARRLNQGFIVLVILVACYVALRSALAIG
ncbi:MAG: sulfite exporter TauE/SafE family protein [Acidimicrobiales bacterium]